MATAYEGAFPYGLVTTVNGGPGNCPALQQLRVELATVVVCLQWGTGQVSGRTVLGHSAPGIHVDPSMEGRAIARPNGPQEQIDRLGVVPSMEGRAIARPNHRVPVAGGAASDPSMEGRAIARPNSNAAAFVASVDAASMEGRAKATMSRSG